METRAVCHSKTVPALAKGLAQVKTTFFLTLLSTPRPDCYSNKQNFAAMRALPPMHHMPLISQWARITESQSR